MKIYTKQGDSGQTQVYAKEMIRASKDDALLVSYGSLDELNAHIGLIVASLPSFEGANETIKQAQTQALQDIQQTIFAIGFAISDSAQLKQSMVDSLEQGIDQMQLQVKPQTKFILPGGHTLAAQVHIARTVARRAERELVSLSKVHELHPLALAYINRLSDFLFVFARYINHLSKHADIEV